MFPFLCLLFRIGCPSRIIVVEKSSENFVQPAYILPSPPSINLTIRRRQPTAIVIKQKKNRREKIVVR
jgi:hypothetical protein